MSFVDFHLFEPFQDQFVSSLCITIPFADLFINNHFMTTAQYHRLFEQNLALGGFTSTHQQDSPVQYFLSIYSPFKTLVVYIISPAENLQQCYTNCPVVVIGIICSICIVVDRCQQVDFYHKELLQITWKSLQLGFGHADHNGGDEKFVWPTVCEKKFVPCWIMEILQK